MITLAYDGSSSPSNVLTITVATAANKPPTDFTASPNFSFSRKSKALLCVYDHEKPSP